MQTEKPNTIGSHNEIEANLLEEFHDPDFREVYTGEFLNAKIATQIKVLREQRGWTQAELALRSGMKQERISLLEDVSYESWTLSVLRRLAKAFDLRIGVEFADFGSFLLEFATLRRETLERKSFSEDPVFKQRNGLRQSKRNLTVVHASTAPSIQRRLPLVPSLTLVPKGNSRSSHSDGAFEESMKSVEIKEAIQTSSQKLAEAA